MKGFLILTDMGKYRGPRSGILYSSRVLAESAMRGRAFGGVEDPANAIDGEVVEVEIKRL